MKQRHKIIAEAQAGHALTAQDQELLKRFHIDIVDGCEKALLVTGSRPGIADPTEAEITQIETAVKKCGKRLHRLHFKKYQEE